MKKLTRFAGALPFFAAVFLNAFVDLGHKIVIQNTVFKLYDGSTQVILTAIVNGLILLPFLLLLSPAGYLSDRFAKPRVMQLAAWTAVGLCGGIVLFYHLGWFVPAFAMTFLLATQSAIYSPAKFGFIKEMFGKERLGEANGVVAALSIVAILAGTFAFSILFELWYPRDAAVVTDRDILKAVAPVGWLLLACSIIELVMMYRLPTGPAHQDVPSFNARRWLTGRLFIDDLEPITRSRLIRLCTIGLTMFWSVGQVMVAAFPAYIKDQTGVMNTIQVQGVLACSGVGIALGSAFAGRVSRNHIETGLLPVGALGIAIGLAVLPTLSTLTSAALTFLVVGFMGGMFIVPLNALIQFHARANAMGKTLAAKNWIQNVGMASFLALTVIFSLLELSSRSLLIIIAAVALIGGAYTVWQLPQSLARFLLGWVMTRRYRLNVQGIKNLPSRGGVLLLGNHISWIDWAVVQIASPRPIRFVMARNIYSRWYLRWFFDLFGCIPIDQGAGSRNALDTVADRLNAGDVVCLFPEGTISRTGHLAPFRRGFERACTKVDDDVVIVPFYMRGLWGSQFSRSSPRMKKSSVTGLTRELVVAFGEPLPPSSTAEKVKHAVRDLSISSWQEYINNLPTIDRQWIASAKSFRGKTLLADSLGTQLSPAKALTGSLLMAAQFRRQCHSDNIGLLLPTSAGAMVCNMAALLAGKALVNLNYTAGVNAMLSAARQAECDAVITSTAFLRKLEKRGLDTATLRKQLNLIAVEDLRKDISPVGKLLTLSAVKLFPTRVLQALFCPHKTLDDIAAIVFSSGSEGDPKGVLISHGNIMANVKQVADVLNAEDDDVMLASLPLFHAFGMTATQFLPLLEGIPVVAHPDPTDAVGLAKTVASHRATIMFGTTTFLRMYVRNKKVHPLMMQSLRFVVAGAEKLSEEVRAQFKLKFNKDIYEGYGATETAPVASVNLPDQLSSGDWRVQQANKPGSVGMPLPGTNCRIVDPETFDTLPLGESGMILVGGAQVMHGYLNLPQKTESALLQQDGVRWYVTGDKGHLDEDGFLYIEDRYSRFAKIAGEMVPLGQLEAALSALLTEYDDPVKSTEEEGVPEACAVNLPDSNKGEKIVLLTTVPLEKDAIRAAIQTAGLPALAMPAEVKQVDAIPKLGSGKTDFAGAKRMAAEG